MNTIAIYSDLICPWCYIGKRRMEEALRQMPAETQVSRSWHPFQLNPEMPREGLNRKMYRSKKFGGWERSQALDAQVAAAGKSVGIAPNRVTLFSTDPARFSARKFALPSRECPDYWESYRCSTETNRSLGSSIHLCLMRSARSIYGFARDRRRKKRPPRRHENRRDNPP